MVLSQYRLYKSYQLVMVVFRVGHKIRDLTSEPNPNQKTRSVPGPKCKNTRMGLVRCYKTYLIHTYINSSMGLRMSYKIEPKSEKPDLNSNGYADATFKNL